MNQADYAKNIERIWDWIEECQALDLIVHGYPNDAVDVDKEGNFITYTLFPEEDGPCGDRNCDECEIGGCDHGVMV